MDWLQYILDHPEMDWNWRFISMNPNLTWEIVKNRPDLPWNWESLSGHPNITLDIINANPDKPWYWPHFSLYNPNLTWEDVRKEPNITSVCVYNHKLIESWKQTPFKFTDLQSRLLSYSRRIKDEYKNRYSRPIDPKTTWGELKNTPANNVNKWGCISKHPNVTWEIIQNNPDKPWQWQNISLNPNITWEIVQAHPEKPWNWEFLSKNPNITWEIIQAHPEIQWNWILLSENPTLTWDIVDAHLDKPWYWYNLIRNPMNYAKLAEEKLRIQEEKKRVQERCKVIKEDLMAAAWHPRRVEKWLETGGFDLLEAM
jgi:hypothetical protein